jgi:hypothetical protein
MQFFEYIDTDATRIEFLQDSPLTVKISVPRSERDFNEVRIDHPGGPTIDNLNDRTGIDPSDIDNPDYNGIVITTGEFRSETALYEITFEFSAIDDYTSIQAIDVHGNVTSFGLPTVPSVSVLGTLILAALFVLGVRKATTGRAPLLRRT